MKSDREFLDGIYEKAERKRQESRSFLKTRKLTRVPVVAAAAVVLLVSGIAGGLAKFQAKDDTRGHEITGQNTRERMAPAQYQLEGKVLEILEPFEGYQRIRVQVESENSETVSDKALDLLYVGKESNYQVGDNVRATLREQIIKTQEYYVIVDEREMNNEKEFN